MVDGEVTSTSAELKTLIQGRCQEFCSLSEQRLRKREKLVHKLEHFKVRRLQFCSIVTTWCSHYLPERISACQTVLQTSSGTKGSQQQGSQISRNIGQVCQVIIFSLASDIQHSMTYRYLMSTVLKQEISQCHHLELYDFLFDRLRAIRQDLILQSSSASVQLLILATCIRLRQNIAPLLVGYDHVTLMLVSYWSGSTLYLASCSPRNPTSPTTSTLSTNWTVSSLVCSSLRNNCHRLKLRISSRWNVFTCYPTWTLLMLWHGQSTKHFPVMTTV